MENQLPARRQAYEQSDLYKMGWVSGFYDCKIDAWADPSRGSSDYMMGYQDGFLERRRMIIPVDRFNARTASLDD